MQFIEFSMDDGYMSTLSIAPEGKFPIRRGNAENATAFVDGWSQLACRRRPQGTLDRTL